MKNPSDWEYWKYSDHFYFFDHSTNSIIFGDWEVDTVDSQGGGEGDGEHWHRVFKVINNKNKTLEFYYVPGYYSSYNGTEIEWDGIYEVLPYEKTVIAWKAK